MDVRWALIGGLALVAHGVRRPTRDVDLLVPLRDVYRLAKALSSTAGWAALSYRPQRRDFVPVAEPELHRFDDVLLFSLPCERVMYTLRAPSSVLVQLIAAQHPIERAMLADAAPLVVGGVVAPVAPLGGVLLVKGIVARPKDTAAIEQTAAEASRESFDGAVAWLRGHHGAWAVWLASVASAAAARR